MIDGCELSILTECGILHILVVVIVNHEIEIFFFKQKTVYDLRISDWSSDVCSSDLEVDEHTMKAALKAAQDAVKDIITAQKELSTDLGTRKIKIGRASCRERVCQYV